MTDPKQVMADYEWDFKKGQAEHWMKISLERPLTHKEFLRYKQLVLELADLNKKEVN